MVLKGRKDLSCKRAWEHFKFYKNEKDVYSNDDQLRIPNQADHRFFIKVCPLTHTSDSQSAMILDSF